MSNFKNRNSSSNKDKDLNSKAESLRGNNKAKTKNISSKEIALDISHLSYEESLSFLDSILEQLQKENIPLKDLEEFHSKGQLYLDHCQKLLAETESRIITIETVDLDLKNQE